MNGEFTLSVRVNDDAQIVIEGKSPDGLVRFEPVILSRAQSFGFAEWVMQARAADAAGARSVAGERVIVAPDGTNIRVVNAPPWSPHDDSWGALWTRGKRTIAGPHFGAPYVETWGREPTDAEVLADYEAWKPEKETR